MLKIEHKFGEKKARSILYDFIVEQLSILHKKRSQEMGLHLRNVSQDSLRKKTQRAKNLTSHVTEISETARPEKSYISTAPIPLTHVSNSSNDSSRIGPVTVSTSSMPQVNKSNKSRLPIFILPEDPEEKRKT